MGTVIVSVDAELGWGFHDLERPPERRLECSRDGWLQLLSLFDEFDLPATWAVVGHLMLEDCDGRHERHPAPDGWFERERTEWADRPDLRFGPDLVSATIDSPVDHELACHSFSHVLFDRPETDRSLAQAEVDRCLALAADRGETLRSFVYPRNSVGHRAVLADRGFTCYRGVSPTADGVRGLFETRVRSRSLLVEPTLDEFGLVNVPASMFVYGLQGPARGVATSVWRDPMVEQARRGIREAIERNGTFHVWLHPNNLVTERDVERMRAILSAVATHREETSLSVETMGSVARRVRERRNLEVEVEQSARSD